MRIFGYTWDEIQAMQQRRYTPLAKAQKPEPSALDLQLLELHGIAGLEKMGFSGVVDRLTRAQK